MAHIAIIILTLDQRETTANCLASIYAARETSFDIVVWDNGSSDGTIELINEKFSRVLTNHSTMNLGVASGRNAAAEVAIKAFDPSHLLFLDNDIIVEPGFISHLLQPFLENHKVGQTQAKLRFMHDRERINDGGGCKISFLRGKTMPVGYGEIDHGQHDRQKKCIACGGAMMVRSDVFRQLGGFDSRFDPFGPEDLDFSLRLRKAGYEAVYEPSAVAYHAVSHTFGQGYSKDYARHKSRHWFVFMNRHAPLWQRALFLIVFAPVLFLRVCLREARRGNLGALKGVISGAADFGRTVSKSHNQP